MSVTHRSWSNPRWLTAAVLLVVVCLFCGPLFVGLGNTDLASDEAIYSYAVDRILETGDWLTPRLIPYDGPFLEKPPLKLWAVAGAIQAGLLPRGEFGLRFLDAVFGAVAFIYVFWLGRRLAGPLCGLVAVLVLFTHRQLLFEHGLRSNNMDAALFLAYCGGAYHFARWVDGASEQRRAIHALAVSAYFTLGFMTKFVAVLFLPILCMAALAWRDDRRVRLKSTWRAWLTPALLTCAVSVPWFVYQTFRTGPLLWQTILGQHVYTRFTGTLDPAHLQPWNYYYLVTWAELTSAGSQWIAAAGIAALAVQAWAGRPWLARLLLIWSIVPLALLSVGTSKVFHYAYPFLPPIAIGAGAVADLLFRYIERGIGPPLRIAGSVLLQAAGRLWPGASSAFQSRPWPSDEDSPRRALTRGVLIAGAVVAVGASLWTAATGPIQWNVSGLELRNSSVLRPLAVAAIFVVAAGHARVLIPALALMAVAFVLPLSAYWATVDRLASVRDPLRVLRDCVIDRHDQPTETHVYPAYADLQNHTPYYYLRNVGPWIVHDRSPRNDELLAQIDASDQQSLLILARDDYERFVREIPLADVRVPRRPPGLVLPEHIVVLTPGPLEACAAAAIAADGNDVRGLSADGSRP